MSVTLKPMDRRSTRWPPAEARFHQGYEPVTESGCWIWTKNVVRRYGQIRANGRPMRAHRYSWELRNGPIPQGMFVCHRCDQPLCVNPDHLFLGSPRDNMIDMVRKRRGSVGQLNGRALMSDDKATQIKRALAKRGAPYRVIAERFGVSVDVIKNISRGTQWTHV